MINVAGRVIGERSSCFIIAEAGVNHNGELERAYQLVDVAVTAGADAVKFQTFKAEQLATAGAQKVAYQKETSGEDETQYEMLKRLELPEAAHLELREYCKEQNILFMSSAFDIQSADLLDSLDLEVFKLPSGEITNIPFLQHVARKNKPMILSTGMSNLGEVETAVRAIEDTGNKDLVLLHCVSNYPAAPEHTNLRAMDTLRVAFGLPVGYSDHTMGVEIPIAAVAMGACVVEKHFTLDRALPGPDHKASLELDELSAMVAGIRKVESALGDGRKVPVPSELGVAQAVRKSLVAAQDIPAGAKLTESMVTMKRPGTGLPPTMLLHLVGRTLRHKVEKGTLLALEMFL